MRATTSTENDTDSNAFRSTPLTEDRRACRRRREPTQYPPNEAWIYRCGGGSDVEMPAVDRRPGERCAPSIDTWLRRPGAAASQLFRHGEDTWTRRWKRSTAADHCRSSTAAIRAR